MVSSPLLALMFDPVFHHHDLVEPKTSDKRLGRARTNAHRSDTRQSFQGFHEASTSVLPNKILPNEDDIGRFFFSQVPGTVSYGDFFHIHHLVIHLLRGSIQYGI